MLKTAKWTGFWSSVQLLTNLSIPQTSFKPSLPSVTMTTNDGDESKSKKIILRKIFAHVVSNKFENCQYNANEYEVFKLEKKSALAHHVRINIDNIMWFRAFYVCARARARSRAQWREKKSGEVKKTKTKPNLHRFNRFLNAFVYNGGDGCWRASIQTECC